MAKKRANGEGNIRKRADGRWEGRYTAGYCSSHQRPPCGAWHRSFDGRRSTDAGRAGAGR